MADKMTKLDVFATTLALLLFVGVIVDSAPSGTASTAAEADCEPYSYCDGTSFNETLLLSMRKVKCDRVPHPRDHCCLPQARHLVCYGISVDGMKLNYDSDPLRTTDFTGLCAALAKLQVPRMKVGKHSSAIVDNGPGGNLVWRYGEWTETDVGTKYIKNLACEITP